MEPVGAFLGRLGAKLGRLGAAFVALRLLIIFWSDFGSKKGCPKGGILEAKTEQASFKKRGANLRAKISPLGVVLVRFWVDFQRVLGSNMLIFPS